MDVIHVPGEVGFVADEGLPEAPLPEARAPVRCRRDERRSKAGTGAFERGDGEEMPSAGDASSNVGRRVACMPWG